MVVKVGEKLKNIFLEVAMNYNKMTYLEKAKANNKIRENIKDIMEHHPKTEREKELDRLAENEYFNSFVEEKDIAIGDANVFRVSE